MTDVTSILGGPWQPPEPKRVDPPEQQLRDAMIQAGIVTPPDRILMDGQLHRFRSGTKGKPGEDRSGWYILFPDGIPAGRFGCWRLGVEQQFRADIGRKFSVAEEMAISRRLAEAQQARDVERKRKAETASNVVSTIWSQASAADNLHPYLVKKGIGANGARVTGDGRLVVPLYASDGTLSSVQYIDVNSDKLYHPGGVTKGCFWWVGSGDDQSTVYLAEGFATAASIHEVTGARCYVAYSAQNLVPVCEIVRQQHSDVVIVADCDASGIGESKANEAASKYGARVVVPPMQGDANDYVQSGGDLSALLIPEKDDWLIQADEFSSKKAIIKWYIKRWIQQDALVMIHGPSGSGKTFVILDMVLRIASDQSQWQEHIVKPGKVVYLAGEGHHGMKGRIAAWKQHHNVKSLGMWVSKAGCDLNTPAGLQRVRESIRALGEKIDVIVVDTLHRFLNGDENSAQDAKTMLDSCADLMSEFSCTVILVHHTGVSDEAQHRARGSSAWRGALDIEISVQPRKDKQIALIQRKSKDDELADPIWLELQSVPIKGWIDDDTKELVSSAVIVDGTKPVNAGMNKEQAHEKQQIMNAFFDRADINHEGKRVICRSALKDYLETNGKTSASKPITPRTAQRWMNDDGRIIHTMIKSGTIEAYGNDQDGKPEGWILLDSSQESAGNLLKQKEVDR